MEIILDIKKYIANFDAHAWFKLFIIDDEFKKYAYSVHGINTYINTFIVNNVKFSDKYFVYPRFNRFTLIPVIDQYHSLNDLPAYITHNTIRWYHVGLLHRDNDLPAMINHCSLNINNYIRHGKLSSSFMQDVNNIFYQMIDFPWVLPQTNSWYHFGQLHRENDLPAVKTSTSSEWYKNGLLHRENDLPAIVNYYEHEHWFYNGKRHRENDLPAVKKIPGGDHHHIENITIDDISIFIVNATKWYVHDQLHRDNDLPSIICGNGLQIWYKYGKIHRDNDLPAIISGDKIWCYKDQIHRDNDLPAIISGNKHSWYHYGKLHRIGLPAIQWGNNKKWYNNGTSYVPQFEHKVSYPKIPKVQNFHKTMYHKKCKNYQYRR